MTCAGAVTFAGAGAAGMLRAAGSQEVGTWESSVASLPPLLRAGAATVTLADGSTLVVGGRQADGSATDDISVYDPKADTALSTGHLSAPRADASAALLDDGRVVISGGRTADGVISADLDIFNPATGLTVPMSMLSKPRARHASARLADGRILIVGGASVDASALADAEVYDPATNSTVPAVGAMAAARAGATATSLIDGRVLVIGGRNDAGELASAEIYYGDAGFFPTDTALSVARSGHTAVLLPDNATVLIAGGTAAGAPVSTVDAFLPALFPDPYTWSMGSFTPAAPLAAARTGAMSGPTGSEGFAFVAGGGVAVTERYRFSTIKTDKGDYPPGQLAVITGTGWQAGETVRLTFQEDPAVHADYVRDVVADDNGNISLTDWAPEAHDANVRFYLMAQGQASARRAQMTFTDSVGLQSVTVGAQSPDPVVAGNPASYSVSLNFNGAGSTGCSTTLSVITAGGQTGLPAGTNAAFSPNPVTSTGSNGSSTLSISTTAATTPAGTYTFTVRANAPAVAGGQGCQGATVTAAATLVVSAAANSAPVLGDIGNKAVNEETLLTFAATANDDGLPNNTLTYSLGTPAAACTLANASMTSAGVFTWTPTEAQGPGTYCARIQVSDGSLTDFEDIQITVNEVNVAPELGAIGNKSIDEETTLTINASATDHDLPANTLTFSLGTPAGVCTLAGGSITSAGVYTWTPTESDGPGTYCVRIQVSDGSASDFEDIQINVNEVNVAPELGAIGNKIVDEETLLTFTATATDHDLPANTLTFSLGSPAPGCTVANGSITSGGVFTWTPTEAQGPGTYCARIQVSDGSATDFEDIQISVNEVNVAPELGAIGNKIVDEETLLTFTATATDHDLPANTLTFSLGTPAGGCTVANASITSGGVFTWTPTEAQGPGNYCARIQVSDGSLSDFEDIEIKVNEVNVAPVLTVPASFSTQWGVTPANLSATATEADLPANTLTFSKVSGPSWVSVAANGTISFSLIPSSAVGANVVTVKVEDNGSPALSDTESFTITVSTRPTTLTYTGKTSGQYSDKSTLSAVLKDVGTGSPVGGSPISGASVAFTFDGASAGSAMTDATGTATLYYAIASKQGTYPVAASFAAAAGYAAGSTASQNFVVNREDAGFVNVVFPGSISVSTTSFLVSGGLKETDPEPTANDGALAGDISKITTVTARLDGISSATSYSASCTLGAPGSGTYPTRSLSCAFSAAPFVVDAYTLTLTVGANDYYVATPFEDAMSIWDPNAGFATGGGTFTLGGDRVSFGFSYTLQKGKTVPRSGFVVVRHMANGGVCRVKSNNQMNAPAVSGVTATLSGKGNYTCTDAAGNTTASQGNITIAAFAEDNATSGIGADRFWVTNGAAVSPNYLVMPATAGANAQLLTGGNVQVPQPGKK